MTLAFRRGLALTVTLAALCTPGVRADDADDLLHRALAQAQAGHASDAEALLNDGVIRYPRHAALHLNYGKALAAQDLNGLAKAHYQAAVAIAPQNADAQAALGRALIRSWESDAAY